MCIGVKEPMHLSGLGIQTMQQPDEIGCDQKIILNRNCRDRAVKPFGEVDLSVLVEIVFGVVPDDGGIRILDFRLTVVFIHGL